MAFKSYYTENHDLTKTVEFIQNLFEEQNKDRVRGGTEVSQDSEAAFKDWKNIISQKFVVLGTDLSKIEKRFAKGSDMIESIASAFDIELSEDGDINANTIFEVVAKSARTLPSGYSLSDVVFPRFNQNELPEAGDEKYLSFLVLKCVNNGNVVCLGDIDVTCYDGEGGSFTSALFSSKSVTNDGTLAKKVKEYPIFRFVPKDTILKGLNDYKDHEVYQLIVDTDFGSGFDSFKDVINLSKIGGFSKMFKKANNLSDGIKLDTSLHLEVLGSIGLCINEEVANETSEIIDDLLDVEKKDQSLIEGDAAKKVNDLFEKMIDMTEVVGKRSLTSSGSILVEKRRFSNAVKNSIILGTDELKLNKKSVISLLKVILNTYKDIRSNPLLAGLFNKDKYTVFVGRNAKEAIDYYVTKFEDAVGTGRIAALEKKLKLARDRSDDSAEAAITKEIEKIKSGNQKTIVKTNTCDVFILNAPLETLAKQFEEVRRLASEGEDVSDKIKIKNNVTTFSGISFFGYNFKAPTGAQGSGLIDALKFSMLNPIEFSKDAVASIRNYEGFNKKSELDSALNALKEKNKSKEIQERYIPSYSDFILLESRLDEGIISKTLEFSKDTIKSFVNLIKKLGEEAWTKIKEALESLKDIFSRYRESLSTAISKNYEKFYNSTETRNLFKLPSDLKSISFLNEAITDLDLIKGEASKGKGGTFAKLATIPALNVVSRHKGLETDALSDPSDELSQLKKDIKVPAEYIVVVVNKWYSILDEMIEKVCKDSNFNVYATSIYKGGKVSDILTSPNDIGFDLDFTFDKEIKDPKEKKIQIDRINENLMKLRNIQNRCMSDYALVMAITSAFKEIGKLYNGKIKLAVTKLLTIISDSIAGDTWTLKNNVYTPYTKTDKKTEKDNSEKTETETEENVVKGNLIRLGTKQEFIDKNLEWLGFGSGDENRDGVKKIFGLKITGPNNLKTIGNFAYSFEAYALGYVDLDLSSTILKARYHSWRLDSEVSLESTKGQGRGANPKANIEMSNQKYIDVPTFNSMFEIAD